MKTLNEIRAHLLIASVILAVLLPLGGVALAQQNASMSAESLVLEETESGLSITLEGPVQVVYGGDRLSADSAVAMLSGEISSLDEALESIELTGNVSYTGADGTSGSASSATYYARDNRIALSGSAHLTHGDIAASASSVTYGIASKRLQLSGGVRITDGEISASSESAEYNLTDRTGNLSGSVEVTYHTGAVLFGDESIEQVTMRAQALYVSAAEGIVRTPEGPQGGRTEIVAGNYDLNADRLIFHVTESDIHSIEAEGNVRLTGPELQYLDADTINLSTEDRVLRAEGNVEFDVRGQRGTAESIEVNFAAGWSIRLVGASIEGTIDESSESEDN
jgi:lipopolysaccharide export system protein LptA